MNTRTVCSDLLDLYSEPITDCGADIVPNPYIPPDGTRPQFRERLLEAGASSLSDRELIAVLLGSGIKGCPVMQLASRVRMVLETQTEQTVVQNLAAIKGLGEARLSVVLAALELGRRYASPSHEHIGAAADICRILERYRLEVQEHFICVMVNGAHDFLGYRVISIGTLDRTLVHPREVFAPVIEQRAAAVILCHNHPSGHCEPSAQDVSLTTRMYHAGVLLGIQVLDHIIMSKNGFYSFAEHKKMPAAAYV